VLHVCGQAETAVSAPLKVIRQLAGAHGHAEGMRFNEPTVDRKFCRVAV
jgi:hypothetical protein